MERSGLRMLLVSFGSWRGFENLSLPAAPGGLPNPPEIGQSENAWDLAIPSEQSVNGRRSALPAAPGGLLNPPEMGQSGNAWDLAIPSERGGIQRISPNTKHIRKEILSCILKYYLLLSFTEYGLL